MGGTSLKLPCELPRATNLATHSAHPPPSGFLEPSGEIKSDLLLWSAAQLVPEMNHVRPWWWCAGRCSTTSLSTYICAPKDIKTPSFRNLGLYAAMRSRAPPQYSVLELPRKEISSFEKSDRWKKSSLTASILNLHLSRVLRQGASHGKQVGQ